VSSLTKQQGGRWQIGKIEFKPSPAAGGRGTTEHALPGGVRVGSRLRFHGRAGRECRRQATWWTRPRVLQAVRSCCCGLVPHDRASSPGASVLCR